MYLMFEMTKCRLIFLQKNHLPRAPNQPIRKMKIRLFKRCERTCSSQNYPPLHEYIIYVPYYIVFDQHNQQYTARALSLNSNPRIYITQQPYDCPCEHYNEMVNGKGGKWVRKHEHSWKRLGEATTEWRNTQGGA